MMVRTSLGLLIAVTLFGGNRAAGQAPLKGIWEPVNYGEDVELNGVFFVTADEGWVTGGVGIGGGVLLHTTDGGEHWEVVLGDPQGSQRPFYDLRFVDQTTGFVAQGKELDDHALLRTTDGATWEVTGTIPEYHPDYRFFSATVGVASNGRELLRTTDAGRSWKRVFDCALKVQVQGLTKMATCEISAFHFPSPTVGYAIGASYDAPGLYVFRTEDAGATWTAWLVSAEENGREGHLFFTNEQTGYICTASGSVLGTSDGGTTWVGLPGAECEGKSAILFADPQVGWTFRYSHLTYTTDGGRRWMARDIRLPGGVSAFSLPRRDRGYAVGDHGMIYRYRVVPGDTAVAAGVAAPAMPPFDTPLDDRVLELQQQVGSLEAGIDSSAADTSAQQFDGGTAPGAGSASPFIAKCCGKGLGTMQLVLDVVNQLVPDFLAKYQNLNILAQGLRIASALPQMNASLRTAVESFRSATDRTSAVAALAQLKDALASLKAVVDTAVQRPQSVTGS